VVWQEGEAVVARTESPSLLSLEEVMPGVRVEPTHLKGSGMGNGHAIQVGWCVSWGVVTLGQQWWHAGGGVRAMGPAAGGKVCPVGVRNW